MMKHTNQIVRLSKKLEDTATTQKALKMRMAGASYPEIARALGISDGAVRRRITGVFRLLDTDLETFRKRKVELLEATEKHLLDHMSDPRKAGKATLANLAYAYTQIHNAGRLEQGLPTITYEDVSREREELLRALEAYERAHAGKKPIEAEVVPDDAEEKEK
jgi:AcrR family transcriptional regulator